MTEQETKVKAWITGNLISFKKPKYKSSFFGVEEVYVIRIKETESPMTKKTAKFIDNLLT